MHEDATQTERDGMNEAGNRKDKHWSFRWYPDRASQSAQEQPGQPNRAGQDAQASQIEPVDAKLGQAGRSKSLGRSPRALEAVFVSIVPKLLPQTKILLVMFGA